MKHLSLSHIDVAQIARDLTIAYMNNTKFSNQVPVEKQVQCFAASYVQFVEMLQGGDESK